MNSAKELAVEGLAAMQMDIKVAGVTMGIMRKALAQTKKGRLQILDIDVGSVGRI